MGGVTSTCDQEYKAVGSNLLHLCQFLVCSGKSQLSNYVNAHCLQISIWTWFMSYHVETTLCHDITTYDISCQPYKVVACISHFLYQYVKTRQTDATIIDHNNVVMGSHGW